MLMVAMCLSAANPYKKYIDKLPFAMPEVKAPQIPSRQVLLSDFGADATGSSLCTDAFAKAVDALTAKGGGHLVVPRGVWLTGPVVLKSNIDLHLEKGAVILFAADESLYPLINTSFEGLDTRRCQSPLSGQWPVLASREEAEGDRGSLEEAARTARQRGDEERLLGALRGLCQGRAWCQHECA